MRQFGYNRFQQNIFREHSKMPVLEHNLFKNVSKEFFYDKNYFDALSDLGKIFVTKNLKML